MRANGSLGGANVNGSLYILRVISLIPSITVSTGTGEYNDPYIIE